MRILTVRARGVDATLARAVALRCAGERFVLHLDVSDVRLIGFQRAAAAAYRLAPAERDAAFRQLQRAEGVRDERGERIRRFPADLERARGYVALAALAETTIVFSDTMRSYVATLGVDPVAVRDIETELVAPPPSATVPATIAFAAERDAVVVWCGDEPVRAAALVVHALANCGLPLIVVAAEPLEGAGGDATFVPVSAGAPALARARVAIPVATTSPSDVIALARLGLRIAVPTSGGGPGVLPDAASFRPWVERDVLPAVLAALGKPPPSVASFPSALPPPVALASRGPKIAVRIRLDLGERPMTETVRAIDALSYLDIATAIDAHGATYEFPLPNGAVVFPDSVARLADIAERSGAAHVVAPGLRERDGRYGLDPDAFVLVRRSGGAGTARSAVAAGLVPA